MAEPIYKSRNKYSLKESVFKEKKELKKALSEKRLNEKQLKTLNKTIGSRINRFIEVKERLISRFDALDERKYSLNKREIKIYGDLKRLIASLNHEINVLTDALVESNVENKVKLIRQAQELSKLRKETKYRTFEKEIKDKLNIVLAKYKNRSDYKDLEYKANQIIEKLIRFSYEKQVLDYDWILEELKYIDLEHLDINDFINKLQKKYRKYIEPKYNIKKIEKLLSKNIFKNKDIFLDTIHTLENMGDLGNLLSLFFRKIFIEKIFIEKKELKNNKEQAQFIKSRLRDLTDNNLKYFLNIILKNVSKSQNKFVTISLLKDLKTFILPELETRNLTKDMRHIFEEVKPLLKYKNREVDNEIFSLCNKLVKINFKEEKENILEDVFYTLTKALFEKDKTAIEEYEQLSHLSEILMFSYNNDRSLFDLFADYLLRNLEYAQNTIKEQHPIGRENVSATLLSN